MKKLLFVVLLSFTFSSGHAAYLENIPQTLKQPDGTVLHCFASGDEFYNWLHDSLGYTIVEDPQTGYYVYALPAAEGQIAPSNYVVGVADPAALGLPVRVSVSSEIIMAKRAKFEAEFASKGSQKAGSNIGKINNLVVFIRFAGESGFSKNFNFMETMCNDSSSRSANSLYNFYRLASYGQMRIVSHFFPAPNGNTIVSYQDINPRNYYQPYNAQTNPDGYQSNQQYSRRSAMLLRAVQYIASSVPSNLDLDYDGDGRIDNICFMVSGSPTGWNDLLWPHRSTLSTSVTINGKNIYDYMFMLENTNGANTCAGVITHEMMHVLGAPDLYRYVDQSIQPVGNWDLMGSTNYTRAQGLGAYMKYKYGKWIPALPVITEPGTYTLYPVNDSTMVYDPQKSIGYRINLPNFPNEFIVLEYRKTNTCIFEENLSGSGILIYRINSSRGGNAYADGISAYDEVHLFRPGGKQLIDASANGNLASAHFSSNVGRTVFNQGTNAYPFYCNGDTIKLISITNITSAGDSIQFTFMTNTVTLSKEQVDFTYQSGNTEAITLNSNTSWTITGVDTSWLNVNILSGDSGTTNLQLSTRSQNNLRVPKTCTLTIQYGMGTKYLVVTQGIAPILVCQEVNNQYDGDTVLEYNFQQYGVEAVSEYFAAPNDVVVMDSLAFYFGNIAFSDSADNNMILEIYTSNASNRPGTTLLTQAIDVKNLNPNAWNTIRLQEPVITSKGITVGYSFAKIDANAMKVNVFRNDLRTEPYFGTMFIRNSGGWRSPSEVSFPGIKNYSLATKLFVCPPSPDTDTLLVSTTNLPLSYDSNLQAGFAITSNTSWYIMNLPEGYSISKSSGTGNDTLVVTTLTKYRELGRKFYFLVRSGSILHKMTIDRASYPLISTKKEVELNYEGTDSAEVNITATGTSWEAQTDSTWLRLSRNTGNAGTQKLVIYPTGENNTNAAFEGCVNIVSTTLNESICIVVKQNSSVGVKQVADNSKFSLYPNPATSQLVVNNGNIPMQTITVYDVVGKEILKISDVNTSYTELNVANLHQGLYFVKVRSEKGTQVRKFVKE